MMRTSSPSVVDALTRSTVFLVSIVLSPLGYLVPVAVLTDRSKSFTTHLVQPIAPGGSEIEKERWVRKVKSKDIMGPPSTRQ